MVDNTTVRITAGFVLAITTTALATGWWSLTLVLAVDFAVRVLTGPRFSPLARTAGLIAKRAKLTRHPTPAPPKRFAATIGLVVTALATIAGLTGVTWLFVTLTAMLVVFAALESLVGFCAGCALFSGLMRVGLIPESVCRECADISKPHVQV